MERFELQAGIMQKVADEGESVTIINCSPFAIVSVFDGPNTLFACELMPLSKVRLTAVKQTFCLVNSGDADIVVERSPVVENGADIPSFVEPQSLSGKTFYIDPGHGGKDPGAVNLSLNLEEKVAALEIAQLLSAALMDCGARVLMSRSGDTYPGISARANEANAQKVDGFISIHLNSAENKSASGVETLCYGKGSTKSYSWAEKVQTLLVSYTSLRNRGVKERPDLGVLRLTKMPAILVETGFISNDAEAKLLFSPSFQEKIVSAITKGTVEQFGG